ncbi:uncharacterized protein [Palaemon carinicauda]|uniref:uncharacterized protein n=1 Tax=Palaemon carinicauda TaxID=392227 RepID=UPI0035B64492
MMGAPVFARFKHLASARLAAVKHTFDEMEKMGLCQKASSTLGTPPSPIHHARLLTIDQPCSPVVKGTPSPLAFFSTKLFKGESSNSIFDCEFLAVHLAVPPFVHFIEGTPYVI